MKIDIIDGFEKSLLYKLKLYRRLFDRMHCVNSKMEKYKNEVIFIIGGIAILMFSLWKSQYGLGGDDEAFYLTIPYRMCQGDKLLLDEWHVSQFSAFLLYPFMKAYLWVKSGNTEGIILSFRHIYICVNMLVSCVLYWKLRKFEEKAYLVIWIYMLFTPYNIMALSYNTMGMMCNVLCVVFLVTANNKKSNYLISGIFFAGMVLCQPILIIVFSIVYIGVIVWCVIKKRRKIIEFALSFLLGCIILAIPIIIYILLNIKIGDLGLLIGEVLNDPEHKGVKSFGELIYKACILYFPSVNINCKFFLLNTRVVLKCLYCVWLALWIVIVMDKSRNNKRNIYLSVSGLLCVITSAVYLFNLQNSYINFLLFPWTLCGINIILLTDKREEKKKLIIVYIVAGMHVLSFLGSNQYGYVFNIALMSVCIIAMIIYLNESRKRGKIVAAICSSIMICFVLYARGTHVFWETSLTALNEKCSIGPGKGIYTTEKRKDELEELAKEALEMRVQKSDNVLLLTGKTVLYLSMDAPLAQYSAWLSGVSDLTFSRLHKYYEINSNKVPNIIYIEAQYIDEEYHLEEWCKKNDFSFVSKESGVWLKAN